MAIKVVAITGAYGGLGAALSRIMAKRGYKLVLGGRNKKKLDNFTSEIKNLTEVISVVIDVRNKKDCKHFIDLAIKKFGRLDVLINNAGIWKMANIDEVTEKYLREIFEANLFGAIYCSQAAIKIMKKQKAGHILNIGSTVAFNYKKNHIVYGSSKAALIGFTGCLRADLESTGIRVSAFSPGGMKTRLFHKISGNVKENFMDPAFVAEKILHHIENPICEWNIILRRPK